LVTISLHYKENEDIDYFDRRLNRFKTPANLSSDINVYFNTLSSSEEKTFLESQIKNKNVIYDKRRMKLAKWKVYVCDIGKSTTNIFFCGNKNSLKYLFFNFLEPIINYKLIDKGFCLIHSSCFIFRGKGYLVNAYPSSGKTSILLKMLKKGADYLSDEMTIISKNGFSYSYPTPISLHDYNFNKNLSRNLNKKMIIKMYLSKMFRVLTQGVVKFPIEVDPILLLNEGRVVDKCRVGISFLIKNSINDGLEKEEIKENIIENIMKINQCQYRYFKELADYHVKKNNETDLKNYWTSMENIIEGFCNNTDNVIINDQKSFEKIIKI
jgi:hypothetical protein